MHGRDHRRIIERRGGGGCGRQLMRSLSLSNTRRSLADREEATHVTNFVDNTDSVDSFYKDGRKISVGDCALFKPPQDSPPFVGIIRCLRYCEEKNLQLGVSWLYRPVELELGKGTLLEASPNEIFYSFHEDETPAASLLHPCKVAFLPKGVELPSGTSSFVCRRVYDVETKCLWWLTDRDYINERQEEVDRLLHITRLEMDASFQPGSHSPKLTNNPMSTSQFKQGSDNVQGSAGSVPSQTKARKRERGDQSFDPVKRERSVKTEEADTSIYKHESSLRSEIAKMKEKGGLVDYESVEKLVQLMQLEKVNKKGNLASCSMLAGVIAATDKFECLTRFIQLKGLPVFDEWLQDVHKGKIGYVSNLKDGEKSVEEFLLALLRALDKLPVNLHALQSCNIGRSVNHLRSHKNLEVQRKARSLVDTWKKRVEAEMNATDAKTGSPQAGAWSAKSRLPDTHGSKTPGGSGDNALKNLASQPASKPMSVKVTPVEPAGNSTSSSPGVLKATSSPASGKEGNLRITAGSSDPPLSMRDEKSSSSSQSHNFSQSFSVKDDARSSPVGATSTSKVSSRHRKSVNGFPGTLASTNQRETGSNRNSSTHRSSAQEKVLPPVAVVDKATEAPPVEGNPHKLIVKIPNRGRSPVQSASGGSYEEPMTSSLASSPVPTGKHEGSERNKKEKGDACKANHLSDANADSWQSNDLKGLQAGSDEGDGSPAPRGEKRSRTVENARRGPEVSKAASSSSVKLKSAKLHGASFSSMNALIESCVKHSEANTSMSPADDVGMNLLASVAAGEICKSDLPPNEASQSCTPPVEELCTGTGNMNLKSTPEETRESSKANLKYSKSMGSLPNNTASLSKQPSIHSSGHRTPDISAASPQAATVCATEKNGRVDDNMISNSLSLPCKVPKDGDGDPLRQPGDHGVRLTNTISGAEEKDHKVEIPVPSVSKTSENRDGSGSLSSSFLVEQKPDILSEGNVQPDTAYVKDSVPEISDKLRKREAGENHISSSVDNSKGGSVDRKTSRVVTPGDKKLPSLGSEINGQKSDCLKTSGEENEAAEPRRIESRAHKAASSIHKRGSNQSEAEAEAGVKVEFGSAGALPSKNEPEVSSKVGFDLNEGLMSDEGKYGESVHSVNSGCLMGQVINPLSTAGTAFSNCVPVSVTVTAAAKGAFVPPVDLLRSKGELGWKGSAITSAFRPAEPRKVLQSSMSSLNISTPDFSSSKTCRQALDIDLNVPDERVLEDLGYRDFKVPMGSSPVHLSINNQLESELAGPAAVRSFGGLDLDLNKVDDTNDMLQCSTSGFHRLDAPSIPLKLSPPSSLHSSEVRRDFDLNGPSSEDAAAERPSFTLVGHGSTHSINTQQALPGLRSSNLEAGNFSPWFSPGTSYTPISIPSSLPDRGEQPFTVLPPGPQRVVGPGCNAFTSDVFRGSILTSQAVPFAPSPFTSFTPHYQMFPFGATVPLPSTSFSVGSTSFMDSQNGGRIFAPSGNSQFLAPASAVSSQYSRPYMVNLSDNGNNGGMENSRKWSRQGLDLNTGPGALDFDSREETAQRQLTLGSSQAHAEDPARMFPPSGGVPKRREPEGGWDTDNMRYKQHSWQ